MSNSAFLSVDFVKRFPYKFWVSTWGRDESYPDGFRYKILTARDLDLNVIDLVLVLEEKSGDRSELKHLHINLETIDKYARTFADALASKFDIEFQEQDYSSAKTNADFRKLINQFGGESFFVH